MNAYLSDSNASPLAWQWPVDLATYDRTPQLSDDEKEAIAYTITHHAARSARQRAAILQRLVQPLLDVLLALGSPQQEHYAPILVMLENMDRRGTAYWGWSREEWLETIGMTRAAFEQQRSHRSGPKARQQVVTMAYLLTHFDDFLAFAGSSLQLHQTAATIFGRSSLDAATQRICDILRKRGYSSREVDKNIQFALALVFLTTRTPCLEAVTYDLLASLREHTSSKMLSDGLGLLSRALADLHLIEGVLPRRAIIRPITARIETEGVPLEWVRWCQAWHDRSPLAERTKENYLYYLRKVGLWLADQHPGITSPEQWDDTLGFAFVAMVNQMKVGDYVTVIGSAQFAGMGKPLTPRSKSNYLTVIRRFFSDLQEIPHQVDEREPHRISHRFNPMRVFETPRAVRRLIGPDPRVIEDAWWWKILAAAAALTEEELPRPHNGFLLYPFAMVRALAITWCYSALRSDEIERLRVGCVRWQWEQDMQAEEGETAPPDATCFLHVPVNKTSTAFWKPVYALVGTCIQAWEKERPPQPPVLDRKTNELVDFLFSYRRGRIGDASLNFVLIPLLCEKAGVPCSDARGRITSHRARATIATLYYRGTRVPLPEIVTAIMQIANALQFAHDQKLIHRDVKPENMLIERRDEVVLSDFGIATIAHSTSSMQTQASVGTIPYMAPEQIQAHPRPASDQYALGVVVYEWLCGERPFDGPYAEILAKHLMTPPPPLREKVPTISPDVEQVVLTALAKDPKQRFGSVQAFATALEQASRSAQIQATSFAQEITILSPSVQSLPPTVLATPAAQPLLPTIPAPAVVQEPQPRGNTDLNTPDQPHHIPLPARQERQVAPISPVPQPLKETALCTYRGHLERVNAVAWSPDGKFLASGSNDKTVQVWDAFTGRVIFTYQDHSSQVNVVRWSPAGTRIASGSTDKTVQVWDMLNASRKITYTGHQSSITDIAWSPNGQDLASCSGEDVVHIWDGLTGGNSILYWGLSAPVYALAWSPDGQYIASASEDSTIQIWDATTLKPALSYDGHCDHQWAWVHTVAWSPAGEHIASGDITGNIRVWMSVSGNTITTCQGNSAPVHTVTWSPDGKCIASASEDSTVQIWEATTGKSVLIHHQTVPVYAVAWSPDGKTIASGGDNHEVQVWQLRELEG